MDSKITQKEEDLIKEERIMDALMDYQERTQLSKQEVREVFIEYLQLPKLNSEERAYLNNNRLEHGIKLYRERTNLSLSAAKLMYDHYWASREEARQKKEKEAHRFLKVTHIVILWRRQGTDKLLLQTELPEGVYPFEGKAVVQLEVQESKGKDYCDVHFPNVPVEIVRV